MEAYTALLYQYFPYVKCLKCTITSKINGISMVVYLLISKLHSILAVIFMAMILLGSKFPTTKIDHSF